MLKDAKKHIILSYVFFGLFYILSFLFAMLYIYIFDSNIVSEIISNIFSIVWVFVVLFTFILFLVFTIKAIILTNKLKYDTEFILMVIGLIIPFTYLIGSIMVLCKNEENLTNLNNNEEKFINKY